MTAEYFSLLFVLNNWQSVKIAFFFHHCLAYFLTFAGLDITWLPVSCLGGGLVAPAPVLPPRGVPSRGRSTPPRRNLLAPHLSPFQPSELWVGLTFFFRFKTSKHSYFLFWDLYFLFSYSFSVSLSVFFLSLFLLPMQTCNCPQCFTLSLSLSFSPSVSLFTSVSLSLSISLSLIVPYFSEYKEGAGRGLPELLRGESPPAGSSPWPSFPSFTFKVCFFVR